MSLACRDARRVFVTALLVYAVFWNPWLQYSHSWNFIDAAVSFVETGRWQMTHTDLYKATDTVTVGGRVVSAVPPGTAVLLVPPYLAWRAIVGPVSTREDFEAFNALLVLAVSSVSAALAAVQVGWLAGWLGAPRGGQIWAAILFALGTQSFQFATLLSGESVVGLAVVTALRLAVEPGGPARRALGGFAAAVTATLVQSAALLAPLLVVLIGAREGPRRAVAFLAGAAPLTLALAAYNTWLFGRPWRTGYSFVPFPLGVETGLFKPAILVDLLVGPRGGLFLYSPYLLLAVVGLALAWRTGRRGEASVAAAFFALVVLVVVAWQSRFTDRALWAIGLGPRMLFGAVPLLAPFAARPLAEAGRGVRLLLAVPSLACAYLGAQAGLIPEANPVPYAVKTWISGTGMGVLFKEALPRWFGMETLHTTVSRPEVTATDLLRLLPTHEGQLLAFHQALFLALNLVVLAATGWALRGLWREARGNGA